MKTYEEMLKSVLEKVQEGRQRQRRVRKNAVTIVALGLCCVVVLIAATGGLQKPAAIEAPVLQTTPGESISQTELPEETIGSSEEQPRGEIEGIKLMYLSSRSDSPMAETIVAGVRTPIQYMIRVQDTTGLNADERKKVYDDEVAFAQQFLEACDGHGSSFVAGGNGISTVQQLLEAREGGGSGFLEGDDYGDYSSAVVSVVQSGHLFIEMEDFDQFLSTGKKYTDVGNVAVNPWIYRIPADKSKSGHEEVRGGVTVSWWPSNKTLEMLYKNPDTPLSSISDTFSAIVVYKDGRSARVTIDLTVDDSGQIYVTQREKGESA